MTPVLEVSPTSTHPRPIQLAMAWVFRKVDVGKRYVRSRLPRRRPLWSSLTEFDESWAERITYMAQFIDRPGVVADFGCGPMWLERMLQPCNSYLPVDYIRR